MKRVQYCSIILLSIIAFGCSNNTETTSESAVSEPESAEVVEEIQELPAVCVWDKLAVRDNPGDKGQWITSLSIGESIKYLGVDSVSGKKTYGKIALNDGKVGWARTDLIVIDAKPAVMVNDTDIYKRPDLLTKSDEKFSKMNIVAVMNTQDSWSEVKGKRSEGTWVDQGWVKSSNLSFEAVDIATAKFALAALNIKDESGRLEAINEILENVDLGRSKFIGDLEVMAIDLTTEEEEISVDEESLEQTEETDSIE
ncbi:MAG: hypothetical protein AAFN93_19375 [Bacteroidota bacterium]